MGQALDLMQCAATGPEVKQAETLFHLALGDAAHNMLFARAIEDALSELFLPFPSARGGGGSQAAAMDNTRRCWQRWRPGAAGESLAAIRAIHDGYWQQVRRVLNRAA